eukprot:236292-Amphidinium_carterae.1
MPHQRVVRHAAFMSCLDCGRQAGKRQDCRQLKKKKVKLRPAGFLAPEGRSTGLSSAPPMVGNAGSTGWIASD